MRKKFLKITFITILLVFVYTTVVNALSFTATMTPSSTTVSESTEFTVAVKVSNLDVGANGINALSGYLSYDEEIFEKISETSIDGTNGWNPSYNAENEGKITLTKTSFVKTEESVFQVTFKTKSETAGRSGQIKFTNIVASNSATEITASDISITINVPGGANNEGDEQNQPDGDDSDGGTSNGGSSNGGTSNGGTSNGGTSNGGTSNGGSSNGGSSNSGPSIQITTKPTNTNTNKNTNTNTNKNTGTNTNTNKPVTSYVNSSNTSKEDIPYTGAEDTIMLMILAVITVAIVFYIKFERINKEMK